MACHLSLIFYCNYSNNKYNADDFKSKLTLYNVTMFSCDDNSCNNAISRIVVVLIPSSSSYPTLSPLDIIFFVAYNFLVFRLLAL